MNTIKYFILLSISFFTSYIFGLFASQLVKEFHFINITVDSIIQFACFCILFILSLIILGICMAVVDKYMIYPIIFLFLLGFIVSTSQIFNFSYGIFHGYLLYLLILLALISYKYAFEVEYQNLIKPKIGNVIYSSSKIIFFLIPLALTITSYNLYSQTNYTEVITNKLITTIKPLVGKLVKEQIGSRMIDITNEVGDPQINWEYISNSITGLMMENDQEIPIVKNLTDTKYIFENNVEPFIESQISSMLKPFEKYIPILASLSFYFLVTISLSFSSIFIVPFGNGIALLLSKLRFFVTEIETIEIERIKI